MVYLLNIATTHYDSLIPLRYYTQELVLSGELALQYYYLSRKSATYAESFYNFRRTKLITTRNADGIKSTSIKPLNAKKRYILVSLLFETFLPYLKAKMA